MTQVGLDATVSSAHHDDMTHTSRTASRITVTPAQRDGGITVRSFTYRGRTWRVLTFRGATGRWIGMAEGDLVYIKEATSERHAILRAYGAVVRQTRRLEAEAA